MKQMSIVYVGDEARGVLLEALAASRGWRLLRPTATMEALAMYVFYLPSLFILSDDARDAMAEEVAGHLATVATPPLLLLSDSPEKPVWKQLPVESTAWLPRRADNNEVLDSVQALLTARQAGRVPGLVAC